jgi:hypothetical protein
MVVRKPAVAASETLTPLMTQCVGSSSGSRGLAKSGSRNYYGD